MGTGLPGLWLPGLWLPYLAFLSAHFGPAPASVPLGVCPVASLMITPRRRRAMQSSLCCGRPAIRSCRFSACRPPLHPKAWPL